MLKRLIHSLVFSVTFCTSVSHAFDELAKNPRLLAQILKSDTLKLAEVFKQNRAVCGDFMADFYGQFFSPATSIEEKDIFNNAYQNYLEELQRFNQENTNSPKMVLLKEKYEGHFSLEEHTPKILRHLVRVVYNGCPLTENWVDYFGHNKVLETIYAYEAQEYLNNIAPENLLDLLFSLQISFRFSQTKIDGATFKKKIKEDKFFKLLSTNFLQKVELAAQLGHFPEVNFVVVSSNSNEINFNFPKTRLDSKAKKEQLLIQWLEFLWVFDYPIGLKGYYQWSNQIFDAFHAQAKKALNYKQDIGDILYKSDALAGLYFSLNQLSFLYGRTYFHSDETTNKNARKKIFWELIECFSSPANIAVYLKYADQQNKAYFVTDGDETNKNLRWHIFYKFLAQAREEKTEEFFKLLDSYPKFRSKKIAHEIKEILVNEEKKLLDEANRLKSRSKKKQRTTKITHTKSAPIAPQQKVVLEPETVVIVAQSPSIDTPKKASKPSPNLSKKPKKRRNKNIHSTSVIKDSMPFEGPRLDKAPEIVLSKSDDALAIKKPSASAPSLLETTKKQEIIDEKDENHQEKSGILQKAKAGIKKTIKKIKNPEAWVSNVMQNLVHDIHNIVAESHRDIEYQRQYNHVVKQIFEAVEQYEKAFQGYEKFVYETIRNFETLIDNEPQCDHPHHRLTEFRENLEHVKSLLFAYSLERYGFDVAQMRNFSNYTDLTAMITHPDMMLNLERAKMIRRENKCYGQYRDPLINEAANRLATVLTYLGELQDEHSKYQKKYHELLKNIN